MDQTEVVMGKVIAFLNQKGGVGKTTMAFNSAFALANRGHKVLCIDMDPQANLSLLFDKEVDYEEHHVHHLLINSIRELKGLHTPVVWNDILVKGDVDLLAAGQDLSGFDLTVAGINSPRQLILKKFLEKSGILDQYDYIILDSPPTLGLLVVNVLCSSDGVMVPFRPDEFSKKGLQHFYEVLEDIEDMGIGAGPQVLAHIPNLVDLRRKQEGLDLDRIDEQLQEFGPAKVVSPFYNRAQLVKSQAQKRSVFDYASKEYTGLQEQFDHIAKIVEESYSGQN
jgi:chromosome partitioning protein